jgi:hypothetical protein
VDPWPIFNCTKYFLGSRGRGAFSSGDISNFEGFFRTFPVYPVPLLPIAASLNFVLSFLPRIPVRGKLQQESTGF